MSYDLTAAADFLQYEAGMSAQELFDEIEEAIGLLATLKGERKSISGIFKTLDLCADIAYRLIPEEAQRENNRA